MPALSSAPAATTRAVRPTLSCIMLQSDALKPASATAQSRNSMNDGWSRCAAKWMMFWPEVSVQQRTESGEELRMSFVAERQLSFTARCSGLRPAASNIVIHSDWMQVNSACRTRIDANDCCCSTTRDTAMCRGKSPVAATTLHLKPRD